MIFMKHYHTVDSLTVTARNDSLYRSYSMTKTEWYAIIASTLTPADKNLFIPEFLNKRLE